MRKEFYKIISENLKITNLREFDVADDGSVKFKANFKEKTHSTGFDRLCSIVVSKRKPNLATFLLEPMFVAHILESSKHEKIKEVTNWFMKEIDDTVKASKIIYCSSVNGQVGGH